MDALPTVLYGARELAELDRRAADNGLSGSLLMERAGQAAFDEITTLFPSPRRWLVFAGGGNNGGDGYVVARLALEADFDVRVVALQPPATGAIAAQVAEAWKSAGGRTIKLEETKDFAPELIVDALFGIGLSRAPQGEAAQMIEAINAAAVPVAALDIPSGLFADTGHAPGAVVQADITPTFICLKPGLLTGSGPSVAGKIVFARLAVPTALEANLTVAARRIKSSLLDDALPMRERNAHKGRFGHVLVVGGDLGSGGAVQLAGEAAQRTGAGLVSVLTRAEHVSALLAARPELMVHASDGSLPETLAQRASVIALGPGLGQEAWGQQLWEQAISLDKPGVLDADGLNLLAKALRQLDNWILTPHPGEAARLLDCTVAEIEQDRIAAVRRLVERYRAVVVLKGAGTLIGTPDGAPPYICDRGNPGMASGGMGDALTGIIVALLAQGLVPAMAARLGVWLHVSAANRAALNGERGLLAGDVIAELRSLVNP